MKILHTSDWHVGKALRGRSRAEEHEAVLAEVAAIAREEAVDLVVVAGDLFETASPTPESERIVYRALLDLAATGAAVVAVAGNHDNERRLQAVEPLFALGRVEVRPLFAGPEAGGVAEVEGRGGERARVALLPFLSQRYVVRADDLMGSEAAEHQGTYAQRVGSIVGRLCEGMGPDTVNLLVAHAMVAGGSLGGGERSAHTIFDYWVEPSAFPAHLHYVALGHLHRRQRMAAACPAWYCGSPMMLDFGETEDAKGVLIVEAHPGAPAEVREVPVRSGARLRVVRGTLADLERVAGVQEAEYLRVHVRESARAGLADEVRRMLPGAVDVIVEAPGREEPQGSSARAGRTPHELFAEYLTERDAADERVLGLFDRLLDEVHAPDPA